MMTVGHLKNEEMFTLQFYHKSMDELHEQSPSVTYVVCLPHAHLRPVRRAAHVVVDDAV